MALITVLGAAGFIGTHLVKRIEDLGFDCFAPGREDDLTARSLGQVIYAIGLTADFRTRPFETVEGHVCKLADVLRSCDFDSLVYLSSTRVYRGGVKTVHEDDEVVASPRNADQLYNISKVMGESLGLASGKNVRVARLSNVYGADFGSGNFLAVVIREALTDGKVTLKTSIESDKDYVSIDDVVELLIKIATSGKEKIYNVASGRNVLNAEIATRLKQITGCAVEVVPEAPTTSFPRISIDRVVNEFDFKPRYVLDDLEHLVELYKNESARG
ncbi:MAG TPA: SDR family oxidoreductase [Pyrinomonadaceae bacterium]|jgi:nucleoside-diphosphate-sugar epimerase|nr:SDR family oxidoreductase [Pyrinomonadaceae bacterium]